MKKQLITLAVTTALIGGAAASTATPSGAIVQGTPTQVTSVPWQVALTDGGEQFCGGSIISPTTIVTAAHCLDDLQASDIVVKAGVTSLHEAGQVRQVASMRAHPSYANTELGDIAVLTLSSPLNLDAGVKAIPLATSTDLAGASTGVVSGWGATSEGDESASATLLSAEVPLVSDDACSTAVGSDAFSETCAGGTGSDSCYGDSGGPLAVKNSEGVYVLAGVVSWGDECGGGTPGVYADVPNLSDWVVNGTADGGSADQDDGFNDEADIVNDDHDDWDDEDDWYIVDDSDWDDTDWGDEDDWYIDDDSDWDDSDWDDSEWDDEDDWYIDEDSDWDDTYVDDTYFDRDFDCMDG